MHMDRVIGWCFGGLVEACPGLGHNPLMLRRLAGLQTCMALLVGLCHGAVPLETECSPVNRWVARLPAKQVPWLRCGIQDKTKS